jgi:lipoyl synthase
MIYGESMMIDDLKKVPLKELQSAAFQIRKENFGKEITFSFPSTVSHHTDDLPPQKDRFAAISITGRHCELNCGHCRARLLETMIPARDPDTFLQAVEGLRSRGALGVLVSGGANREGEVPLERFVLPIRAIKDKDPQFKIIVHTGLIRRGTARELKEARVDQVLIDVIGDEDTIREVYHLNKKVEDYEETLNMLKDVGHRLAPHIIIGHHFGEIRGEWKALDIVARVGVETLVLVVLKPPFPSGQNLMKIPKPEETSRISAIARVLNPSIPMRMGCIRPAHPWKAAMEKGFIDSGVNTIAYPLQGTVDYAKEIGLETRFSEMCCSLI